MQIPASVQIIGEGVFKECKNLQKVIFTENSQLKEIGKEAFCGCGQLKRVVFTEGSKLTVLKANIFRKCPNLQEVVFTKTEQLNYFYNSKLIPKLTKIILPDDLIVMPAYLKSDSLREVGVPRQVRTIEKNTFAKCKNLEKIMFAQ